MATIAPPPHAGPSAGQLAHSSQGTQMTISAASAQPGQPVASASSTAPAHPSQSGQVTSSNAPAQPPQGGQMTSSTAPAQLPQGTLVDLTSPAPPKKVKAPAWRMRLKRKAFSGKTPYEWLGVVHNATRHQVELAYTKYQATLAIYHENLDLQDWPEHAMEKEEMWDSKHILTDTRNFERGRGDRSLRLVLNLCIAYREKYWGRDTPWKFLGVEQDASREEIEDAWFGLVTFWDQFEDVAGLVPLVMDAAKDAMLRVLPPELPRARQAHTEVDDDMKLDESSTMDDAAAEASKLDSDDDEEIIVVRPSGGGGIVMGKDWDTAKHDVAARAKGDTSISALPPQVSHDSETTMLDDMSSTQDNAATEAPLYQTSEELLADIFSAEDDAVIQVSPHEIRRETSYHRAAEPLTLRTRDVAHRRALDDLEAAKLDVTLRRKDNAAPSTTPRWDMFQAITAKIGRPVVLSDAAYEGTPLQTKRKRGAGDEGPSRTNRARDGSNDSPTSGALSRSMVTQLEAAPVSGYSAYVTRMYGGRTRSSRN